MNQNLIFAPMGAMALLTFAVLGLIPLRRFRAAFAGQVEAADFRFGESAAVPPDVSIPNRNYMNLLELPTLFYPACLMFYVTGRVGAAVLAVAWAFVALRAAHSAVHLTYNNVMHRLVFFGLSNAVLGALWVMFFLHFQAYARGAIRTAVGAQGVASARDAIQSRTTNRKSLWVMSPSGSRRRAARTAPTSA